MFCYVMSEEIVIYCYLTLYCRFVLVLVCLYLSCTASEVICRNLTFAVRFEWAFLMCWSYFIIIISSSSIMF